MPVSGLALGLTVRTVQELDAQQQDLNKVVEAQQKTIEELEAENMAMKSENAAMKASLCKLGAKEWCS